MYHWIDTALRSTLFYRGATALLTSVFWWSGLRKVWDFPAAIQEMEHFGLQPAVLFAAATVAVQLLASIAIVAGGRWAPWGAAALAGFTLATIPVAHRFWDMQGLERLLEQALVQDHLSVIGGLAVAATLAHHRRQNVSAH